MLSKKKSSLCIESITVCVVLCSKEKTLALNEAGSRSVDNRVRKQYEAVRSNSTKGNGFYAVSSWSEIGDSS